LGCVCGALVVRTGSSREAPVDDGLGGTAAGLPTRVVDPPDWLGTPSTLPLGSCTATLPCLCNETETMSTPWPGTHETRAHCARSVRRTRDERTRRAPATGHGRLVCLARVAEQKASECSSISDVISNISYPHRYRPPHTYLCLCGGITACLPELHRRPCDGTVIPREVSTHTYRLARAML
jgi:hypothetical protein